MAKETNKQAEMNVEEVVSKTEAFLTNNKKTILGGIIAVVAIIAGVICYNNFVSTPGISAATNEASSSTRTTPSTGVSVVKW